MKIIYVHHAHRKKGNPPSQNDNITKIGEKDANIVADLFEAFKAEGNIKAIYTSEFLRCTKTASIINKNVGVPIIIEPRLNEHGSNAGETWLDTQTRIKAALKEIVFNSTDDNDAVVCVTSGINLSVFIALAFNVPINEKLPFVGVPSCSPVMFEMKKEDF